MPGDCNITGYVLPSGTSLMFAAASPGGDPTVVPSLVTDVVTNDDSQSVTLAGNPSGGAFTLAFAGQTTAPIPATVGPPATYFQWNKTDLPPGTYDLGVNIFAGGTQSPNCYYEVFNDATPLGNATLNHALSGAFGGPVNPTPLIDQQLVNRLGQAVSWFPLGRYTISTGKLRVRLSGNSGQVDGRNHLDADQLRIATVDGATVYRVDSATPPATFADFYGQGGHDPTPTQVASSSVDAYQVDGTGAGPRYLVDPAAARAAIQALPNVGVGNVTVTGNGSALSPLVVTFTGALGDSARPLMTAADGAVHVARYAAGGILPAITITRAAGGAVVGPIALAHDWRYYNSIRPTMPTAQFFLPQYLPDVPYKYAVAYQYDNDLTGGWQSRQDGIGLTGYTNQVWHSSGVGPAATYCYRPTPPGQYRVSATWPQYSGGSTDVTYTVRDLDGNALGAYHVNQTLAPSGAVDGGVPWQVFGTFTLGRSVNGGHFNGLVVTQSNGTGSPMQADAVRFERVSADDSIHIRPGDTVTYDAGRGWLTSQAGPAPAASAVALDNRSGGTLYVPSAAATTMKIGWNLPALLSLNPRYYVNALLNNDGMDVYPTVSASSRISVNVANGPVTFGGDRKSAPSLLAGDYDVYWRGASNARYSNQLPGGCVQDNSRAIFPAVNADGYHRRTFAMGADDFHYGTELTLEIEPTGLSGGGPNYAYDISDVWIVPKDTDIANAPKYHPVFAANIHGAGTIRHLDGMGAIEGNAVDFADYMKPQSRTSRNIAAASKSFSLASNPVTIRDYVYAPGDFPNDFDRTVGAVIRLTFASPHGLRNGMIYRLDDYTGDLATVAAAGDADHAASTDTFQVASAHPLFVYYLDDHSFASQLGSLGYGAQHVTNVIANAGGRLFCNQGPGSPLQDLVEINNDAGADFYCNTHFANTDDCLTAMGAYLAAHVAPGKILRHECSNEVWNFTVSPNSWAKTNTRLIYGGSAVDMVRYYCETAHRHHTLVKAAWVAGGRDPADYRSIMGAVLADSGATTGSYAQYYHAQIQAGRAGWAPFDELVVANYMTNTPSFAAPPYDREFSQYRVIDGMTAAQHLDMWEVHRRHGRYEGEVPNHIAALVGRRTVDVNGTPTTVYDRPEFSGTVVGFYEGGPDILMLQARDDNHSFPYPNPNNAYRNHAMQRHPRFFGILQDNFRIAQESGAKYQNVFMYQGSDTRNIEAWGAYRAQDQLPYVPGDAAQDAIQVGMVDRQDLIRSISGGAVKAFAARYMSGGTPTGPDFAIAVTGSAGLVQGGTATRTVTLTALDGYTGTATLSVIAGLPTGVTVVDFTPATLTGGGAVTSTLTLAATGSAAVGSTTITVRATDAANGLVHTGSVGLTVAAASGGGGGIGLAIFGRLRQRLRSRPQ